jgi:hypothetical protein
VSKRKYEARNITAPYGTKEYRRQYMALWNEENRSKVKQQHRDHWRRKNGVFPTRPEPAQCEICGDTPGGNGKRLHADHDHLTSVFRGWLCHRCNMALGLFKDSSDLLVRAARYLREVL